MSLNVKESLPRYSSKDEEFVWWRRRFTVWLQLVSVPAWECLLVAESKLQLAAGDVESDLVYTVDDKTMFGYLYLALDQVTAGLFDVHCMEGSGIKLWRAVLCEYASRDNLRKIQLREKLHTIRMMEGSEN